MKLQVTPAKALTFVLSVVVLLLAIGTFTDTAGAATQGGVTVTPTEPTMVREATLFAFDDVSIPATYNLHLTMHQAQKHPNNPVVPLGEIGDPDEWQHRYYGTVIRHEGKFKMWYIGASKEGFVTPSLGGPIDMKGWRYLYAESADGVHWEKPNLGLDEFRGSRDNNMVLLPKGFRGYHANVLYEPEDPDASRRFKMMALIRDFGDHPIEMGKPTPEAKTRRTTRGPTTGTYVPLYSPDGLRWRVAKEVLGEDGKVILLENLVTGFEGTGLYKWKGLYYLSGQGKGSPAVAPYGRHVEIFSSPDLIHWSKSQTMGFAREGQFNPIPLTRPFINKQTHEGASVWNRGNVLIGITGFWTGSDDWNKVVHDLGFLVSNDGLHFREPIPDFVFVPLGEDGRDWDEAGLAQGQGFENVGDKTYMWYGQMDQRVGTRTGRPWKRHGGIGLVTLDRARFGSLSVREPSQTGELVTSNLKIKGSARIWVNVEGLGPDASLSLELLDRFERPLSGYSGQDAALVQQSGLRVPVSWKGTDLISNLRKSFKIKVSFNGTLNGAISFYALYVESSQ